MKTKTNHAIDNARGHLESIRELVERTKGFAAGEDEDEQSREALDREFDEYPLSVLVRSGWYVPGSDPRSVSTMAPCEFEILLSTGGPALRIIGELDEYGQPEEYPKMQWQDWGTPWTDLHGSDMPFEPSEVDRVLLRFAEHFWYGEGA